MAEFSIFGATFRPNWLFGSLQFGQSHPVSLLGFDGEGTGVGLICFVLPGFGNG